MSEKIAVIGLGYVGLPLAVALARRHDVVAFDISSERIDALRQGIDSTHEVAAEDLNDDRLRLADDPVQPPVLAVDDGRELRPVG